MKKELLYIWLQQAVGLYSRLVSEVFAKFTCIEDIYNCEDFSFLGESKAKYIKRLENKDNATAFETLKRCESLGVRITGYYDELYPEKLRRIEMPPVALYSIGEFRNLNKTPCIAIVGTRNMTDYGKETAESFAYNFTKSGAYVVSGLAKGIDTAAHRGAIMADGYTVAVLGNPIGDVYPKENKKAFETLYKRGLVVSELYPGAPRTRADFPNRNRIISGLCHSVVIAEAGETSGALITARHALSQGRAVYAVPGAIGAENAGTNKLIKTGIPAATEPMDVLGPLLLEYPESVKTYEPSITKRLRSYGSTVKEKTVKPEPKEEKNVFEEIKNVTVTVEDVQSDVKTNDGSNPSDSIMKTLKCEHPITADEIAVKTGLGITEIMTELTVLEIEGKIISCPGGRFISSKF